MKCILCISYDFKTVNQIFYRMFELVCVGFWSMVLGKPNNDSEYNNVDVSINSINSVWFFCL